MTKKEIEKFLANTKVYVNGKSKEIQEKLFELGYSWLCNKTKVTLIYQPFLFIFDDKNLHHSNDMEYFTKCASREITAEDILSLELTEPTYRPFKDKEECWTEMSKHLLPGYLINKKHEYINISLIDDRGILLIGNTEYSYKEALRKYTFADGTPFGIKRNNDGYKESI